MLKLKGTLGINKKLTENVSLRLIWGFQLFYILHVMKIGGGVVG